MNVTLTLSTPERPEPHARTMDGVTVVRYTADSEHLDMTPRLLIGFKDRMESFALTTVLDMVVSP